MSEHVRNHTEHYHTTHWLDTKDEIMNTQILQNFQIDSTMIKSVDGPLWALDYGP